MGKRFTDGAKRTDRWYGSLSLISRSVVDYLRDVCDVAGVWKTDFAGAEKDLGWAEAGYRQESNQRLLHLIFPQHVHAALDSAHVLNWQVIYEDLNRQPRDAEEFGDPSRPRIPQVVRLTDGYWWMPKFVFFQHLNPDEPKLHVGWNPGKKDAPAHIPVMRALKAHNLLATFEGYYPGSVSPAALAGETDGNAPVGGKPRKLPTLEEVRAWPESRGVPDAELQLFHTHYQARKWRDGRGILWPDFPLKLIEWKEHAARNHAPASTRESRQELELIDRRILQQQKNTHRATPESLPTIRPEALEEIRRLKARREEIKSKLTKQ